MHNTMRTVHGHRTVHRMVEGPFAFGQFCQCLMNMVLNWQHHITIHLHMCSVRTMHRLIILLNNSTTHLTGSK